MQPRQTFTAQFREATIIVSQFVTIESTGFVANIQNSSGETIGDIDETPKPLEEAKLLGCDRASQYVNGVYAGPKQIMEELKTSWVESTVPHTRIFG
jgi:hypothetical protein